MASRIIFRASVRTPCHHSHHARSLELRLERLALVRGERRERLREHLDRLLQPLAQPSERVLLTALSRRRGEQWTAQQRRNIWQVPRAQLSQLGLVLRRLAVRELRGELDAARTGGHHACRRGDGLGDTRSGGRAATPSAPTRICCARMTCGFSSRCGKGMPSSDAKEPSGDSVPEVSRTDRTPPATSALIPTPGSWHQYPNMRRAPLDAVAAPRPAAPESSAASVTHTR